MEEKTSSLSPGVDAKGIETVDSFVNGETEPNPKASYPNITERSVSNVIDTINSLKEQLSQIAAAVTSLKAHFHQLETRMNRLESQRDEVTCSGFQDEYEGFVRTKRAQLASYDLELLEILREGERDAGYGGRGG